MKTKTTVDIGDAKAVGLGTLNEGGLFVYPGQTIIHFVCSGNRTSRALVYPIALTSTHYEVVKPELPGLSEFRSRAIGGLDVFLVNDGDLNIDTENLRRVHIQEYHQDILDWAASIGVELVGTREDSK